MTAGRALLAIAVGVGAALILVGAALAATGEVVPQLCTDDNDRPSSDECPRHTNGLAGVVAAAASPDGTSVYTASVVDDAIVEFARSPSGSLLSRGCSDDNDAALDACQVTTNGLDGAFSVAVSADGSSVYAAGFDDDAIVSFARNPATGSLTPHGCVDDDDPDQGPDECADQADGLDGVASVAVSPDGRSVYAASSNDDAVVRFHRDGQTGALTPAGCVDDDDSGADSCDETTSGLDGARSVAVSPDGTSVYVASGPDDALVHLSRETVSGRLTPQGCIDDQDTGPDACGQTADGLDGARAVAVSPDGGSVYVAGQTDDAIAAFDRNPGSGSLGYAGCVADDDTGPASCSQTAAGLDGAFSLSVSADGLSLYSAALDDDAVATFARAPQSGAVTPQGCVDDNDPPQAPDECERSADGLDGALGVASSAGTTSLYVLSVHDESVLWLVRQDETPPDTTITRGPSPKTKKRRASFSFVSSEPFSTFECKLDKRGFKPCGSPRTYGKKLLQPGRHSFRVRALDEPGNTDRTPARMRWRVRG